MAEPQPSAATQAAVSAGVVTLSIVGTLLTIGFLKRFGNLDLIASATVGFRPAPTVPGTGNILNFPIRKL